MNLHLPIRRVKFQKLTIIGLGSQRMIFHIIHGIRQGHFAVAVVVSITFPVGGNVRELRLIVFIKGAGHSFGKRLSAVQ